MADVADAIAAAAAAQAVLLSTAITTAVTPPTSPHIKHEPPADDAMIIDSEPPQDTLQSPLKRSRSQSAQEDDRRDESYRDEKRLKTEPVEESEIVDIASLVQQAEASVMHELISEPEDHDISEDIFNAINGHDDIDEIKPDHNDVSQDILNAINQAQVKPDHDDDISQDILNAINEAQAESAHPHPQADPTMDDDIPPDTIWSNPTHYTRRKHIIPALGSLAVDVLIAWSEQSLEDTMAILGVGSEPDSEVVKEYTILKSTFDAQRRLLSEDGPLLDAQKFHLTQQGREVIRIVNLATLCASVFSTNEIGWEELNEQFLRVFVTEHQPLSQDAAELFLSLKTQIYLATLESEQLKSKNEVLDGLFTTDLQERLQAHHSDTPSSEAEIQFIASAAARKAMLLNESTDSDNIQTLSRQFSYEAFLDSLNTYINDNIETFKQLGTAPIDIEMPPDNNELNEITDHGFDGLFDLDAVIAEASRAAQSIIEPAGDNVSSNYDDISAFLAENISKAAEQAREASCGLELPSAIASAAESASRATMLALQSIQQTKYHPTAPPQSTSQAHAASPHSNYNSPHAQPQARYYQYSQQPANNAHHGYQASTDALPPNQSDTTPALYEKARQAAAARSSTHARREGTHSTRRPWSPEEEKALMMGLDMVKGPHWSQILGLFGPNGSMSNILADRTQVQLKDKARNLKLFFLKTNSEMPYYLHCVTGELKTRAPTQAARKEAEEKAKSEEQQAHMNGVMTLANGLQNHAPKPTPPAVASRPGTPGQPLSHPNSQSGTPRVSQIPAQKPVQGPMPAPRPTIPAPQPVYLPLPPKQQPPRPQQAQQSQPSQQTQQPQNSHPPLQSSQQSQQRLPSQQQQSQHQQHQLQQYQTATKPSPVSQPQPHSRYSEQQTHSHNSQERQISTQSEQPQSQPQSQAQAQTQQQPQPPPPPPHQSPPQQSHGLLMAEDNSIESAIEQAVGASLKQESGLSREEDALFDLKAAIEREAANALASNGTSN